MPLAHYLKGLGILRLVAEQADENARGAWQRDVFVLRCALSREELNLAPMEETRRAAAQMRQQGQPRWNELHDAFGTSAGSDALLAEVDVAVAALHALVDRLEAARGMLSSEPSARPVLAPPRGRRATLAELEAPGA